MKSRTGTGFSKNDTNIAKGIGIALILFSHVFENTFIYGTDNSQTFLFYGLTRLLCKYGGGFMAVFSAISGYGIYKQSEKKSIKDIIVQREVKLLGIYIPVYIICSLAYITLNENGLTSFLQIYGLGEYNSISIAFRIAIDMLGLRCLFHMPTLNLTWWYMSVEHVIIFILPLLIEVSKKLRIKTVVLAIIIGYCAYVEKTSASFYGGFSCNLLAAYIGYYIGDTKAFEHDLNMKSSVMVCLFCLVLMIAGITLLETLNTYFAFSFLGITVMLYVRYSNLLHAKGIENILAFVGKNSGIVFMVHSFFLSILECFSFIYDYKYALVTYIVTMLLSLAVGVVANGLLKTKRYQGFLQKSIGYLQEHIN